MCYETRQFVNLDTAALVRANSDLHDDPSSCRAILDWKSFSQALLHSIRVVDHQPSARMIARIRSARV
jgi:hypothetical protein